MKNKKKANSTSWKPGQSGNPNGPPQKENSFRAILEKLLNEDFVETKIDEATGETIQKNYGNTKKLLMKAMIKHAINGNIGHLREILERMDGKVPDVVQGNVATPATFDEWLKISLNEKNIDSDNNSEI